MEVAGDNQDRLDFISATETDVTSAMDYVDNTNNASNVTVSQIPEPSITEKGYRVQEIRDNLCWVTDGNSITIFFGNR